MIITAFNSKNNNSLNKPKNLSFGMIFSEAARPGIQESRGFATLKIAKALEALESRNDSCVLTHFGLSKGNGKFDIEVEDKYGINVYKDHFDRKDSLIWQWSFGKVDPTLKVALSELEYLLSNRFLKKVARLDKKHQGMQADRISADNLLDSITNLDTARVIKRMLPDFMKLSGYSEEEARAALSQLVRDGETSNQRLNEIAQGSRLNTLTDRCNVLEDASKG